MNALIHDGEEPLAFWEREITLRFENGKTEITVRGDSIAAVLEILFSQLTVLPLDAHSMVDLSLSYWHLTEGLDAVTIKSQDHILEDSLFTETIHRQIRRLAADVKMSLMVALARHHITLTGERGEL